MEPFATVQDLEARWRPLTPTEATRAATLLVDASVMVAVMCDKAGVPLPDTPADLLAATLKAIVCDVVKRAMQSPIDQGAGKSEQRTAGPYSEMNTYATPSGDMYMTASEKSRLGIGKQHISSVMPPIKRGRS